MTKQLASAVKAFQLYQGSSGCRIKDQQKLYTRAINTSNRIARQKNIDPIETARQISDEARRRGPIIPFPGKDI